MLTKADIRYQASMTAYSRGKELYELGHVLSMDVDDSMEGMVYLDAKVKGSSKNTYEVSVAVDLEEDTISMTESFCSCPSFSSYEGICKHCVAVLLKYIDWQKSRECKEQEIQKRLDLADKLVGIKRGSIWKQDKETTSEFKKLLLQQSQRNTLPLIQQKTYGQVKLEPYVFSEMGDLKVEFRIGISKMYVMKNVLQFAQQMEQHEDYSYGKSLRFVHMMEAFEEDSRPLVSFLLNWVRENKEHYRQTVTYGYRNSYYGFKHSETMGYSYQKVRTLALKGRTLDDFMETMLGRSFVAAINYIGEKEYFYAREEYKQKVYITGKSDGIEVSLQRVNVFTGAVRTYYFIDGVIYQKDAIDRVRDFEECLEQLPDQKAFLTYQDIPAFCRDLLPVLEKSYQVQKIDFDEEAYGMISANIRIYLDAPRWDFIQCKVLAFYGEKSFSVYEKANLTDNRDIVCESRAAKLVSSYCSAYDEMESCMVVSGDEEKIYELLTEGIPAMQQIGEVYISESMKKIQVQDAPKVSVGVSLAGNLLELSMTAGDMSKEELIDILSKYKRKQKYFRLKNGNFITLEAEGMDTLLELKEGLQLTDKQLKQDKITVPKYRTLYLDAQLKDHPEILASKNREFKALVRNMKTVEDNDFEIPESVNGTLREYQKKGYLWIKTLKSNGFCGILADDMGLGKTLQVISFLVAEAQEYGEDLKPVLVVTPASLVFNWKSELEKFAPELSVKMVVGTASERKEILSGTKNGEILITSYDLLRRDVKNFESTQFSTQIIDEAQFIKNKETQAARAVKGIQADFKLALTGTPVENRLSELWSIFDYLMPGFLYTYKKFKDEIETPIVQDEDRTAINRLQKMIRPFVLRRLKKEVLTDLPDKLEESMMAELTGEQQKLYDAHVKRMKLMLDKQSDEEFKHAKIQLLSELTRLRQICCDPALVFADYKGNSTKLDMCMNLIENAINAGHKILLFSQFTSMLERVEDRLKEADISFYSLTGSTSKQKRIELVEAFNQDDTSVFCISLKAGGTGLNLTSADIVIHYDPWWNVAVQNQATDRAHRIGQKNVVNVYKLIVKGTIEENILKLQEKKKELADQILGGEGMGGLSLTKEEMLSLLQ